MFINKFDLKKFMTWIFLFPMFLVLGLFWSFGFMMLVFIFLQVFTGFLYACNLIGMGLVGFGCLFSKLYIISEVTFGWLIVNLHSILPNIYFVFMFLHAFRYGFYPGFYFILAWLTGIFLYIIFLFLFFSGYSLVFGFMGYWGVIVLVEVFIFMIGDKLTSVLLSDLDFFSNSIVFKLYVYHYLIGFFSLFIILYHVFLNHKIGSSSSLCSLYLDGVLFISKMLVNDFVVIVFSYLSLICYLFFFPEYSFFFDNYFEFDLNLQGSEKVVVSWIVSKFFVVLSFFTKLSGMLFNLFIFIFMIFYILISFCLFGTATIMSFISFIMIFMMFFIILISFYNFSWFLFYSYILNSLIIFMFLLLDYFMIMNVLFFFIKC